MALGATFDHSAHAVILMDHKARNAWYSDGLKFTCTQCGNCCTGAPGFVYVSEEEISNIAAFLRSPGGTLGPEYLRKVGRRYSLTEDRKSGDCCFLKHENGKRICAIYPVRPLQCRTWPFWDVNLESPRAWSEAAADCPGMNQGRHYDLVQVQLRLDARTAEELPE